MFTFYGIKLQIDNQLFGSLRPVLLFMTPPKQKGETMDTAPALQFSAHKMLNDKWNADIYTVRNTRVTE